VAVCIGISLIAYYVHKLNRGVNWCPGTGRVWAGTGDESLAPCGPLL
jgi:hypothetical protein